MSISTPLADSDEVRPLARVPSVPRMIGTILVFTVGCVAMRYPALSGVPAICFVVAPWLSKSPARRAEAWRAGQRPVTKRDLLILGAIVVAIVALVLLLRGKELPGFVRVVHHPATVAVMWLTMCSVTIWVWIKESRLPADAGVSRQTDREGAE